MAEEKSTIIDMAPEPFSWWSWRPGIKPASGLMVGGLLTILGLILLGLGLFTLIAGILDGSVPPLQVRGVITSHAISQPGQILYLHIRLQTPQAPTADFPSTLSLSVSQGAYQNLHDGQTILVDYAPHLLSPYALSSIAQPQQTYSLPGSNALGNPLGSLALLLIGLVLLPYPALLTHWSWRDLIATARGVGQHTHITRVIERRSNAPDPLAKRAPQPGLMRTGTRPWYGVAVQLIGTETPGKVLTFRVNEERYAVLHTGEKVRIAYSPNLHYLYKVESMS